VFGYVDQRNTFVLSAAFGLVGWFFGWLFLPDTTGLSLDELDRWVEAWFSFFWGNHDAKDRSSLLCGLCMGVMSVGWGRWVGGSVC
jgi:hypothetical protein